MKFLLFCALYPYFFYCKHVFFLIIWYCYSSFCDLDLDDQNVVYFKHTWTIYAEIFYIYLILAAILQCPAVHKKKPQVPGFRRAKVNRKIAISCIKSLELISGSW